MKTIASQAGCITCWTHTDHVQPAVDINGSRSRKISGLMLDAFLIAVNRPPTIPKADWL